MLKRLGWLIGLSQRSRQTKTLDAHPYVAKPVLMVDTVQEIAVYIHRFHNLDLFQQGWYQIKISMRWEDGDNNKSCGIPSRVVQYEALDSSSNDSSGVWKIDDKDNSFLTQPFRIKYARQDVRLCMMVSFTMPLQRYEGPATSAVILRFELLYSPIVENISLTHSDDSPASVHDFRIPPKALSGVHSYCPVHFDTFHAVLIDVSVHVSVMKSASYKRPAVLSSDASSGKSLASGSSQSSKKAFAQIAPADKLVSFVKALLGARDTLLEEMQKLSKAIDQTIDLSEFVSTMDKTLLSDSASTEKTVAVEGSGQGKQQNNLELKTSLDLESDDWLHNFSKEHLSRTFHLLGTQLHYLWNTFLTFHRDNNTKILEHLRDTWTKDRRAEWSIWMVYSKVEMPHHFISGVDDTSNHSSHKRVTSALKLSDPAQVAATRAELHRRSIAQMRINNRTVQDMHIFGDPMRVPIVIIERVWNAPRRTFSENSYMRHVDKIDSSLLNGHDDESGTRKHNNSQHGGRELKIVVFVHGFQGHHLDLRLIRNQWLLIDPKIECLMSEANEDKTHGDFREMGQRLAQEVVSFFKRKMDKHSRYGRLKKVKLSFVGHSIGNVIIRTALADSLMDPYRKYLHTYISLSGPHLGYLYSSNSLFNSGLWLLKKLKSTQVIHQLTLTDDPDLQNTFFYKLCKQKTLDGFKNIILLSSPQDGYVPYHSARIQSCQPASFDNSKRGVVFLEMLNNCMDQIRGPSPETPHHQRVFMRCDVNFDTTLYGRNLNSFIGRAAHIEFLESDIFARFIMWSFQDLFRSLYLFLEVDDIDRFLKFNQVQDGGNQLRQKRQALLDGLAVSLQLVDPLGKNGQNDGIESQDNLVFLRIISLRKGRKLLTRYLQLLIPGSDLMRIVSMAIFRHLRSLFGARSSDTETRETTIKLAKVIVLCIQTMDLGPVSACLAAVSCSSEQPPLRPLGSPVGDEATVILKCALDRAAELLRANHYNNAGMNLWRASFDEFFNLLMKHCISKYDSIMQNLNSQLSPHFGAEMTEAAAQAIVREMPIELLRASFPHISDEQKRILVEFLKLGSQKTDTVISQ